MCMSSRISVWYNPIRELSAITYGFCSRRYDEFLVIAENITAVNLIVFDLIN